jgi:hypothetical protein
MVLSRKRVGTRGRIFSVFPGPLVLFWWWLRKVRWEDYEIEGVGEEEWRRHYAQQSYIAWLAEAALVGTLSFLVFCALRNDGGSSEIVSQVVHCLFVPSDMPSLCVLKPTCR